MRKTKGIPRPKTASIKRRSRPKISVRWSYSQLVQAVVSATAQMRGRAAAAVNQALVFRNWIIGAYLIEFEQHGHDRAKYGARLLERVAEDLAAQKVKGLDERTLRDCRSFYQCYPQIRGPADPESKTPGLRIPLPLVSGAIRQTVSDELSATGSVLAIRGPVDPELAPTLAGGPKPLSPEILLQLQWSHFLQLIRIDDPWKRAFYENECLKGQWSKRQLRRQIESLLYERTGLSRNKTSVVRRAHAQNAVESIEDIIRDPYVLEFAGLAERPEYSEDDLESALLDHLQRFLLELGSGFCFEARQFRITLGKKHERVDLVFYHRQLRCHVLLELKVRAFRHADAGQMNFYVNWFKRHMMAASDQPPVGIILCTDKDHTEVEFATAGMDSRLFVSRYLPVLPSAAQLRAFVDRDRAIIEALHRPGKPKPRQRH